MHPNEFCLGQLPPHPQTPLPTLLTAPQWVPSSPLPREPQWAPRAPCPICVPRGSPCPKHPVTPPHIPLQTLPHAELSPWCLDPVRVPTSITFGGNTPARPSLYWDQGALYQFDLLTLGLTLPLGPSGDPHQGAGRVGGMRFPGVPQSCGDSPVPSQFLDPGPGGDGSVPVLGTGFLGVLHTWGGCVGDPQGTHGCHLWGLGSSLSPQPRGTGQREAGGWHRCCGQQNPSPEALGGELC